jgi:3'-5' exoribonuclease
MDRMNTLQLKSLPGVGNPFMGIFLLRSVNRRTAKNGRPFLSVEVGDRHGTFTFTIFEDSDFYNLLQSASTGAFLQISGVSDVYNERFSPRVQSVRRVTPKEVKDQKLDADLYDGPRESVETLRRELEGHIARIGHEPLRRTVEQALAEVGDLFWTNTAAVAMHHAYRHGLLEHSTHVTRAGVSLLPHYPFLDADLTVAGLILHDIGKALEYTGDGVYERTRVGILQGHVVLGYRIVRRAALSAGLADDLTLQLEHIILCHQGLPEYGAAVLPSSPEGIFVSLVDNLDAKMAMAEKALDTTPANAEFSEKILGLEGARVFTGGK